MSAIAGTDSEARKKRKSRNRWSAASRGDATRGFAGGRTGSSGWRDFFDRLAICRVGERR